MIEDAKLVPTIINTVRFNKLVSHRDQTEFIDNGIASPPNGNNNGSSTGNSYGSNGNNSIGSSSSSYDPQSSTIIGASILSFREFLGVMVSVSLGVPDKGLTREQRLVRLLGYIKESGLFESIDEEMKYLPLSLSNSTPGNTPSIAVGSMRRSPGGGPVDAVNYAIGTSITKRSMTGVGGSRQSPTAASFVTPTAYGTTKAPKDIKTPLGQQNLTHDLDTHQEQGERRDVMGDRESEDARRQEQEQAVKIRAWQVGMIGVNLMMVVMMMMMMMMMMMTLT